MTDINEPLIAPPRAKRRGRAGLGGTLARSEAEMLAFAELLFFAYRDFTNDADAILSDFSFGRAHHRVLHFVNRHPGLRVADLLDVLKITKQSLGRVLKQLVDNGYIEQRPGPVDRRQRLLYPTESGRGLAKRLRDPQVKRIAAALAALTPAERKGAEKFLRLMINPEERDKASRLIDH
jgi:DNA-binding MarR family transcriptional regulator